MGLKKLNVGWSCIQKPMTLNDPPYEPTQLTLGDLRTNSIKNI